MYTKHSLLFCAFTLSSVISNGAGQEVCIPLGEQCNNDNNLCCVGCCINSQCVNTTACVPPLICGNKSCKEGFACFQSGALCVGGKCNVEPTCRCTPVMFLNETNNPCDHVQCRSGQDCQSIEHPCLIPPCPKEVDCVDNVTPCINITCPQGSQCTADPFEPTQPRCIRSNPCTSLTCYEDSVCQRDPFDANQTICVPLNNYCHNTQCPVGYVCGVVQTECSVSPCPYKSQCIPNNTNPCAVTSCPQEATCTTNPYNPASAICVYPNPCLDFSCPDDDSVCQRDDNDPMFAICVPISDICEKINCSQGYECSVEITQCLVPPCPAVGKCVKVDPCSTTVCPNNTNCITDPTNETNALCVYPDPCVSHNCPYDSVCQRDEENPHLAKCVPIENFCKNALCPVGYVCGVKQIPCSVPPYPYSATCIQIDTNPCADTSCPEGITCIINPHNPASAICVYPDPCISSQCPNNTICQRDDNNPTSAQCIPISDICAKANCSQGYECSVEITQCLIPPCSAVGKCVKVNPCSTKVCPNNNTNCIIDPFNDTKALCISPDPCVSYSCPYDSVCQRDEENPRQAKCVSITNICTDFACPDGFVCGAKQVSCYVLPCAYHPKCVPNDTNPCVDTSCPQETACITNPYNPLSDICVYPDPCVSTQCPNNTICQRDDNNPQSAKCVPISDICSKANCSQGYECSVEITQCLVPPCPAVGRCVKVDPCSTKVCPNNTNCITDPTNEINALCVTPDPCVSHNCAYDSVCQRDEENPHLAKCVPLINFCKNTDCPVGYVCGVEQISCSAPPNPYSATCIRNDTNPCAYTTCLQESTCITNPYNPASAICVYPDPCVSTQCPNNTICQRDDNNPTSAQCIPISDICAKANCSQGYECSVEITQCLIPPCPAVGKCVKVNPCSTKVCPNNSTNCIIDPFNDTKALCISPDPCVSYSCPYDSVCQRDEENPRQAKCVPITNICADFACPDGFVCGAKQVSCYVLPCAYHPKCVPKDTNPCVDTSCPQETACITNPYNPLSAICVYPDPCVSTQCPNNTICQRDDNNPQSAKCVPISDICSKANCSQGYECSVEITQCLVPPCPAVGRCVKVDPCSTKVCPNNTNCITDPVNEINALCVTPDPCVSHNCAYDSVCQRDEENPHQAKCVPITNFCKNTHCPVGYVCGVEQIPCSVPPNPYSATCIRNDTNPCAYTTCLQESTCITNPYNPALAICVYPDPCVSTQCPNNTICQRDDNNPQSAKCIPISDICAKANCSQGYECSVEITQCLIPPCPAVGKCILTNPCSQIVCPFGSDCVINPTNTSQASCVFRNPCTDVVCPEASVCQRHELNPILSRCVPTKEICDRAQCQSNFSCTVKPIQCLVPPCPFIGECVDPCAGINCTSGYHHVVKDAPCQNLGCPKSCICEPSNPCLNATCVLGKTCIPSVTNPAKEECVVYNPCLKTSCAIGTKCIVEKQCTSLTSCSVVAKCVLDFDPCLSTFCFPFMQMCHHTYNDDFCLWLPCSPTPVCYSVFNYPCNNIGCNPTERCIILKGNPVCRPLN